MKAGSPKTLPAEKAIQVIQSGHRVVIGHACGEPRALTAALAKRLPALYDVETVHMIGMGESPHCAPEAAGHVRHNSVFVGGRERKAIAEGRADYTPRYFSRIPALFTDGSLPPDVALLQVSPPDRHGFVSLGVSVDYGMQAARAAAVTVAQINRHMPRCHGDAFLPLSAFDIVVEEDLPLPELQSASLTEVERAIGQHCADLIEDGDTLQLGIGSLPDAVLLCLQDKKDLGIHSEMFSDGVVALVQAGVITGARKTLHPGKLVATFLMGTKVLYDFVDDNPMVYMAPVETTNDPAVIAKNDRLISINSAVQVDLMGQVCAESVGPTQISGVGGQVDFIRGAQMSRGGLSIIAMPSTARGGTLSKIVPVLDEGAAVTTGRNDVMFVCTEYGIVNLQGLTLAGRAKALIDIAHPAFQESLTDAWEKRFCRRWPGVALRKTGS